MIIMSAHLIIVGTKDCPISKVLSIIDSSNSLGIFHDEWSQLARKLGTPEERIKKFRDDRLLNKLSLNDTIHDVLEEWVARRGSKATLNELLAAMDSISGLTSCIESLQNNFLVNPSNKIRKYCRLPNGLPEYLSSTSKFLTIRTLDSEITCEKIRENATIHCQFHEWRDFIKLISSAVGLGCHQNKLHIITDCTPVTVNQVISKIQDEDVVDKLVFVILYQKEEESTLSWKEKIQIRYDSLDWNDLSPDNQVQTMEKLSSTFKIQFEEEQISELLRGQLLVDLLKQNPLKLFKFTVPQQLSYYVNRTILTRNMLSMKLFEIDSSDIFIFAGMDWNELSSLVKGRSTDNSTNQLQNGMVTAKYLLLDQPNHFHLICDLTNYSVHLIRRVGEGRFRWVETSGSMRNVQLYIADHYQDRLGEQEFLIRLQSNANQPVCISDTPGMGKTVMLTQIANDLSKKFPQKNVFFFAMTEFIRHVRESGFQSLDMKTAIQIALQNAACDNNFGKVILQSKLDLEEKVTIELLLDGFDEVDSTDLALSFEVIEGIATSFKSIRLWVTTRPHLLEEMERRLNVLGHNLEPFQESNQIQFLSSYWSVGRALNVEKLGQFAGECMTVLKSCMNTQAHDIAGIPLQCLLLAEVYKDEAVTLAQPNPIDGASSRSYVPQKPIKSISNLYNRLMENKVQKYKSISGGDKLTEVEIMDVHVWMSLKLLFPGYFKKLDHLFPHNQHNLQVGEMLKVGLLVGTAVGDPKFVHRTFAEYFAAWFIINRLESGWSKELNDFFFDRILACQRFQFGLKHNINSSSYKFLYPVICYFLNSLLPNPVTNSNIITDTFRFRKNPIQLAHACANGDFVNLFKFFQEMNGFNVNTAVLIFNDNYLLITIYFSSLELIKLAFAKFEEIHPFELELQKRTLQVAVRRGDFAIVEFLLKDKHLIRIVEYTRLLLHECVSNSRNKPEEKIQHKILICRRLAAINPSLLEDKDGYGRTPLLASDVHIKLRIELMTKLGTNLFAQNEDKDTLIHLNVIKKESGHEYHALIQHIPEDALQNLVQIRGSFGHTPLMRLVDQIDPLPETIERFKKARADFNAVDQLGYSILAVAVMNGRNATTIRGLIAGGAKVTWKKHWKRIGLLHYAAEYGNADAVRVLVEWMDVNIKEWTWSTPLDYAIWSDRRTGNRFETGVELHQLGGLFRHSYSSTHIRSRGHTLLHEAVATMNLDSIKLLLYLKVDVNAMDHLGNTPLHLAVRGNGANNYFEVVKLLLDHNANPNAVNLDEDTPFQLALKTNSKLDLRTFKILKSKMAFWTPPMATFVLKYAIQQEGRMELEEFQLLLGECETTGADFNYKDSDGNSLLHMAAEHGHFEAVRCLLSKGTDIHLMNNFQETVLHKATNAISFAAALKIIKYFIDNGSVYTMDHSRFTFLHRFISKSPNPSQFHLLSEYLVGKGHSKLFNVPGGKGEATAFQMAVWCLVPEAKTLTLLHSSGVNFNSVDKNGNSALIYAVRRNRSPEFLSRLIQFGVDYKRLNNWNRSLLHDAAAEGNVTSLKFFLELRGLDVNGRDTGGNAPIHCALFSKSGKLDKVRLLIQMGAQVDLRNDEGLTPLDIAKDGEDETAKIELAELLSRS